MVQYLTNAKGRRTAVIIPIKEWEAIKAKLAKQEVLDSVRRGYMEMQEMEKQGVKGKSWEELMRELNEED